MERIEPSAIPTVDLSRADAATRLRDAITTVGFVQIVGHGFDLGLVDEAYASMDDVELRWTEEQRAALDRPRDLSRGLFRRWTDDGVLDRMIFQFVPYDSLDDARAAGAAGGHDDFFVPNAWPVFAPEFTDVWKRYEAASRTLCRSLLGLFALALDLPPDHFDAIAEHDITLHSVNWYPRQPARSVGDDAIVMNPAHADSGLVTLLHQRGTYEGLQVRLDGRWVTVPVVDDAFVINIGHLMRRVTNGTWPATIHRVVSGTTTDDQRNSIATHFIPAIDAVLAPVPSTVGPDGPRFEPISSYDWQHEFMERYVLRQWSSSEHEPAAS